MAKKEKQEEAPMGAPMWIVTFTDMISLLLTFFIMLLTFSSMETEKMKQATGNLAGAFGAMTNPGIRSRPDVKKNDKTYNRKTDRQGPTDPSMRKDQIEDELKKLQDKKIFNTKITVEDLAGKRRLKLQPEKGRELFQMGSAVLEKDTEALLREIAKMFATLPVRLVVEVHIDELMGRFRSGMTARELTLRQAITAAKFLEKQGIAPENCGASGMGTDFPAADNETPEGRYLNRRLEILVIPWHEDEILKRHAGGF